MLPRISLAPRIRAIIASIVKEWDVYCPTCGYYCLGNGGMGCIDKPSMLKLTKGDDHGEAQSVHPESG